MFECSLEARRSLASTTLTGTSSADRYFRSGSNCSAAMALSVAGADAEVDIVL